MADPSAKAYRSSHVPCSPVMHTHHSGDLISLDESVPTCESTTNPVYAAAADAPEYTTNKDGPEVIVDIDNGEIDDAAIACEIYKHLREAETSKRPSTDFLEKVQKDITPRFRAILTGWLSGVVEEFGFTKETLYLSVNYADRYLSGNELKCDRLQLLGIACLFIAAKYEEEEWVPPVQRFYYMTGDTYNKEEILKMESNVLNYLNFEITVPTTECFLKRYIRAAQGSLEVPSSLFEFLANYIAELSVMEYNMISYKPSMIAASSVFLARLLLQPKKIDWDATLSHYTLYKPSDLSECVRTLRCLLFNSFTGGLDRISCEYLQHKYENVAKKFSPFFSFSYSDDTDFDHTKQRPKFLMDDL